MALVCLRLRGAHLFPPGTPGHRCTCPAPGQHGSARGAAPAGASRCAPPAVSAPPAGPLLAAELLSLLPGFLLVLSAAGKLVYISENVSQVLGLSMVRPGRCGVAAAVPARLSCELPPSGAGTLPDDSSPPRWSSSPRGTRSLTSWRGERGRMCARSSSWPRSSQAGVRLGEWEAAGLGSRRYCPAWALCGRLGGEQGQQGSP